MKTLEDALAVIETFPNIPVWSDRNDPTRIPRGNDEPHDRIVETIVPTRQVTLRGLRSTLVWKPTPYRNSKPGGSPLLPLITAAEIFGIDEDAPVIPALRKALADRRKRHDAVATFHAEAAQLLGTK
jgi:hypothetical protein